MRAGVVASGLHVPPPLLTLTDTHNTTSATSLNIGDPTPGREVIVVLANRFAQLGHRPSAVTIAGTPAAQDAASSENVFPKVTIWRAAVPNGTEATIAVTYGTFTVPSSELAIYASSSPLTVHAAVTGGSRWDTVATVTFQTAPHGAYVAGAASGRLTNDPVTEFDPESVDLLGQYHRIGHGRTTGSDVTLTAQGNPVNLTAVAYQPAPTGA